MAENLRYYASLVLVMFLWGASWISVKLLVSLAPLMIIGLCRYAIAAVLFLALLRYQGSSLVGLFRKGMNKELGVAGLTGIFGFMFFGLIGTRYTTAGQASIIAGLNPVTVSIFAYFIHSEKPSRRWQYTGFFFAFLGIVFVTGVQALIEFNPSYVLGNSILVLSMICWGIYSSVGKSLLREMSPTELTGGSVFVGLIVFALGAAFEISSVSTVVVQLEFWLNVLFLGALSAFFGFVLYFQAIEQVGATRSGVFISLVPVFGTITAVLLLGESIYWTFIVGLILVVSGILILNFPVSNNEAKTIDQRSQQNEPF